MPPDAATYTVVSEAPSAPPLCPVPSSQRGCNPCLFGARRQRPYQPHVGAPTPSPTGSTSGVCCGVGLAESGDNTRTLQCRASGTFATLFAKRGAFRPDVASNVVSTRAQVSATAAVRYRIGEGWTAKTLGYVRRLSTAPGIRIRLRVVVTRAHEQIGARTFSVDLNCAKRTILRWVPAGT